MANATLNVRVCGLYQQDTCFYDGRPCKANGNPDLCDCGDEIPRDIPYRQARVGTPVSAVETRTRTAETP